ncbi:MAG TPA: TetR/AcrR family transcriptional regulator [Methylomirabilota bacterium]|nr:TetR/AcrR family transcriptional regulator [Methylomirabilota bacterium]
MAIATRYNDILNAAGEVFGRRGYHQASIREIARACGLSLAGLYHYVGGKDELLFLTLDRALDTLRGALERARATARTPELRLLALIRTHLDFGFHHPSELKVVNRDWEHLAEPRRSEIAAKRQAYVESGLAILRELDPHGRSGAELVSATNLLLGMLNGIARRPFLKSGDDTRVLAATVGALFLYGFLERSAVADGVLVTSGGGEHDD